MLMKDVTPHLFPDVREPIELRKENDILRSLAMLHASFWASSETEVTIIAGTMMMLWSKALGYQSGTERGMAEWEWWVERLDKIVREL